MRCLVALVAFLPNTHTRKECSSFDFELIELQEEKGEAAFPLCFCHVILHAQKSQQNM